MAQPLIKFLYYLICEQRSDFEALLAVPLGRPEMEGYIERGCLGIQSELADSRVGFLPGDLSLTSLYRCTHFVNDFVRQRGACVQGPAAIVQAAWSDFKCGKCPAGITTRCQPSAITGETQLKSPTVASYGTQSSYFDHWGNPIGFVPAPRGGAYIESKRRWFASRHDMGFP